MAQTIRFGIPGVISPTGEEVDVAPIRTAQCRCRRPLPRRFGFPTPFTAAQFFEHPLLRWNHKSQSDACVRLFATSLQIQWFPMLVKHLNFTYRSKHQVELANAGLANKYTNGYFSCFVISWKLHVDISLLRIELLIWSLYLRKCRLFDFDPVWTNRAVWVISHQTSLYM
jgi:hypothetical protein